MHYYSFYTPVKVISSTCATPVILHEKQKETFLVFRTKSNNSSHGHSNMIFRDIISRFYFLLDWFQSILATKKGQKSTIKLLEKMYLEMWRFKVWPAGGSVVQADSRALSAGPRTCPPYAVGSASCRFWMLHSPLEIRSTSVTRFTANHQLNSKPDHF